MKNLRIFLQVVAGIVIITFILRKLDLSEVLSVIGRTDTLFFILACLSYLCLNLVLASRLSYLLARIGYRVKYLPVFLSHMGGMLAGDITPGRSGYFLTPPILKKTAGVRITDGMACIFAPQAIEFILKVGGAVAAIWLISAIPGISKDVLTSAWLGAIFLLIVGILMLLISWQDEKMSLKFVQKLPFFNKFTENISFFKERSIQVKENFNAILIMTFIGWFFAALQWFYLGRALGIELPYYVFFLLHPLLTILMFVPVSPAGLGLLEGGAIVVFSFFNIPAAEGLAFSVLVRVSILLVDLIGMKTIVAASDETGMKHFR